MPKKENTKEEEYEAKEMGNPKQRNRDWEAIAKEWEKIAKAKLEIQERPPEKIVEKMVEPPKKSNGKDIIVILLFFLLVLSAVGNFMFYNNYYNVKEDLDLLRDKYTQLQNERINTENALNDKINSLISDLEALRAENLSYIDKINSLETEVKSKGNQVETLNAFIDIYKERIKKLEEENEKLRKYYYKYPYTYYPPYWYYDCYSRYPTTLTLSPASVVGTTVTLTATLTYYGTPLYNRPIRFYEDGVYVGIAYTNLAGVATLSFTSSAGAHSAYATFGGGGCYYGVTSNTITYTV